MFKHQLTTGKPGQVRYQKKTLLNYIKTNCQLLTVNLLSEIRAFEVHQITKFMNLFDKKSLSSF